LENEVLDCVFCISIRYDGARLLIVYLMRLVFWISTGCGRLILFNITERGNGIGKCVKPFFAVSTLDNVKTRHLGASESLKSLAVFQCATHNGLNKSSQLFPILLPLSSVILNNIKCPHPVEIQNIKVYITP